MFSLFQMIKIVFSNGLEQKRTSVLATILGLALSGGDLIAAEIQVPPLTNPLLAHTGTTKITADWLLNFRSMDFNYRETINWANDHTLIYTLPGKKEGEPPILVLYDLNNKKHQKLGEGVLPKSSPDGQWIAFVKGKDTERQLWLMNISTGDTKQLSSIKEGLGTHYRFSFDFIWSPDSKNIVLEHQPYTNPWENIARPESKIALIDIATGQYNLIISIDGTARDLAWLPKTENVVFVKERVGSQYNEEEDKDWIQSLNIRDKSIRTLAQFDGLQQFLQPTPSPDGNFIALLYDAENPIFNFMTSIGLLRVKTDKQPPDLTQLTHELQFKSPTWSPDSHELYVLRIYGAYKQIYKINAKTGKPIQITQSPLNIKSYSLSPDGKYLAWIGNDAHGNHIVRVALSDGAEIQTIDRKSTADQNITLTEVREIEWKSTDYPVNMRGLLVMPLNYQEGKHYPLIVDIHGGDVGASLYLYGAILVSTPLEWQLWAAKGYAVFIPEFRSSASFGSLAISRDLMQDHDRLGGDLKDIEAGVDALIAQGIVDAEKMAVIGHSAGALRANWLSVSTHRYKAVVSKEGWADEWIQALHEPPSKRHSIMYGGTPWDVPENYLKNSALHHAIGAYTPTLFLMGNPSKGGIDTYQTVFQLYYILKNNGIDTQYKNYPHEGHLFEKFENRKDALEQSIKWIDKHLG